MAKKKEPQAIKLPYEDEEFYRWSKKPSQPKNRKWYETVMEKSKAFALPADGFSFLVTIINFSNRGYLFFSESAKSVTGYTAREYMRGGLNFAMGIVFEEDHDRIRQMHMDILQWHFSKPVKSRTEYRYSQQFRIVRKDGGVIWLETHDVFLDMDPEGKPLICFQLCLDVTHLKKDVSMNLKISQVSKTGEQKLVKQFTYPLKRTPVFTNREMQVLKFLAKGLASKQIASKLGIREATVSKHRQNMLRKTNLLNTGALVNYAWNNHLLS